MGEAITILVGLPVLAFCIWCWQSEPDDDEGQK